jgi:hypothetical protein
MDPPRPLIDQLYRERVLRARDMDPAEKAILGARLFDYACRSTMDGIRSENPGADNAEVLRILKARLQLRRRREERERQERNR